MVEIQKIYENENILVVNKPSGIPVYSTRNQNTLVGQLVSRFPQLEQIGSAPRYGLVHRLDKGTSGIIIVAKNNSALSFLQQQFKERKVEKKYWALVHGRVDKKEEIKTLIGPTSGKPAKRKVYLPHSPQADKGKEAITYIYPEKNFENFTLLEVKPKTGRTHQIRVHLAWIHHPVAGDQRYGFKDLKPPQNLKRLFLHAFYLKIKLPPERTKEFQSEMPQELKIVISCL